MLEWQNVLIVLAVSIKFRLLAMYMITWHFLISGMSGYSAHTGYSTGIILFHGGLEQR